jgi:hypothetical protein
MTAIIDSYSEINMDNFQTAIKIGGYEYVGQTFTNINQSLLNSCKFYLRKEGTPTGNAYVEIYNLTGTPGTNAHPTGTALATSDNFDISTLAFPAFNLITFTFSGANIITLNANTIYGLSLYVNGGGSSNWVDLGTDLSSPTHNGNLFRNNGSWTMLASGVTACCFYVYGTLQYVMDCLPATFTYTAQNITENKRFVMICKAAVYNFTGQSISAVATLYQNVTTRLTQFLGIRKIK